MDLDDYDRDRIERAWDMLDRKDAVAFVLRHEEEIRAILDGIDPYPLNKHDC